MTAPARLVERNRRNAQLSTGPRTAEGKAISRANSVKHGFCANPAAGVVEDPGEFDALLAELNERIGPTNPVEEGLAHRIGVCLWRLQRAARIDAAMTDVSVVAAAPGPKDISVWIDRIDLLFQPIYTVEHDPAKRPSWLPSGEKWCTFKRPGLVELDRMREPDGEIWQDGAAIAAMVTMLEDLRDAVAGPWSVTSFTPDEAQKLAWLLGEVHIGDQASFLRDQTKDYPCCLNHPVKDQAFDSDCCSVTAGDKPPRRHMVSCPLNCLISYSSP